VNRSRKDFERKQLDDFLRATSLGDQVKTVAENERPDFLLTLDKGRRIAIEHTQPRDEVRAANGHLLPTLTRKIRAGLQKDALPLWVHMTLPLPSAQAIFDEHHDDENIAAELLSLIRRDRQGVRSPWVEYSADTLRKHPVLSVLEEVHVCESGQPIATWGSKNIKDRLAILQEAIRNKTEKLLDYQNNVDAEEYWLLVVSGPGLGCIPSLLAKELRHGVDYERIYLMDEFGRHCFLLQS
jgi:hypothetical protein